MKDWRILLKISHRGKKKIRSKTRVYVVVTKIVELKWNWASHIARPYNIRKSGRPPMRGLMTSRG